jgi:plastocyanin
LSGSVGQAFRPVASVRTVRSLTSPLAALVLAVALLFGACGGGDDEDPTVRDDTPAEEGAPEAEASEDEAEIVIENSAFTVKPVEAGKSVTVLNKDGTAHTVTADAAGGFNVEVGGGDTGDFVAGQRGEFPFHCDIHPTMKGTLRVD